MVMLCAGPCQATAAHVVAPTGAASGSAPTQTRARAAKEGGNRRHGEAGLDKRTERVESFHLRPLAAGDSRARSRPVPPCVTTRRSCCPKGDPRGDRPQGGPVCAGKGVPNGTAADGERDVWWPRGGLHMLGPRALAGIRPDARQEARGHGVDAVERGAAGHEAQHERRDASGGYLGYLLCAAGRQDLLTTRRLHDRLPPEMPPLC